MDAKVLARLTAIVIAAVAITAAAVHLARVDAPLGTRPVAAGAQRSRPDPLGAELRRCQLLGAAALGDAQCLAAWDQNRRRFLTPAPGR